jgi:hypothetical protein
MATVAQRGGVDDANLSRGLRSSRSGLALRLAVGVLVVDRVVTTSSIYFTLLFQSALANGRSDIAKGTVWVRNLPIQTIDGCYTRLPKLRIQRSRCVDKSPNLYILSRSLRTVCCKSQCLDYVSPLKKYTSFSALTSQTY